VALLDADQAKKPVRIETLRPGRLKLALGVAVGVLGVCVAGGLIFFLTSKPARKTVREVVKAAEALVKKSPVTPADEAAVEGETLTPAKRGGRLLSGSTRLRARQALVRRTRPAGARAHPSVGASEGTAESPQVKNPELPLGTARSKVREMFGEPDLEIYKIEKDHEVEHLVYVNRAQNNATSVLLVDGRVASVYSGMPSIWSWRY
jgi:hypothetical protein